MYEQQRMMRERYQSGRPLPWDSELPPPEVQALAAALPPGRALDLGCGYGRTAIYLARRGWQVEAIDYVAEAVTEARRRAHAAHVTPHLLIGDVTALPLPAARYTLAIDVGCAHSLSPAALGDYIAGVRRVLAPGAHYLLYCRLRDDDQEADRLAGPRPHPLDRAVLCESFADGFSLLNDVEGERTTQWVHWRSAWFHWQRDLRL